MTAQLGTKPPQHPPQSARVQLKCGWELPSKVAPEVIVLSRRWAAELGRSPFDPDWDRIFALERAGLAAVWAARSLEGVLVGYLFCTDNRGMFTGERFNRIEAGYLAPEWRNGLLGLRYIKSGVKAMQALGAPVVEWQTNDAFEPDESGKSRLARVLARLGFKQVGTSMRLG